jgi:SAM-dependent methyltransferase
MKVGRGDKKLQGHPMEGVIATWYTRTTFKDIKRHKLMAAQLAPKIPAGGSVLEIAPGPGFFCIELAKLGNYRITGLDISKSFVEIASKNAAQAGVRIDFRQGNASDMPFEDATFDFTFCQAAFKNFSEPVKRSPKCIACCARRDRGDRRFTPQRIARRNRARNSRYGAFPPERIFNPLDLQANAVEKCVYHRRDGGDDPQTPFVQSRIEWRDRISSLAGEMIG